MSQIVKKIQRWSKVFKIGKEKMSNWHKLAEFAKKKSKLFETGKIFTIVKSVSGESVGEVKGIELYQPPWSLTTRSMLSSSLSRRSRISLCSLTGLLRNEK